MRELPLKAARDCAFSPGGQYFAAVNNTTVHVYCAYTCASLAVLRGHNGKVRPPAFGWWLERCCGAGGAAANWQGMQRSSPGTHGARSPPRRCVPASFLLLLLQVSGLWWSPDDSMLVTAGLDGAVYEWRVLEGRRTRDFVQKGWNYSGVVSRPPRGGGGAVVVGRPVADAGSQT